MGNPPESTKKKMRQVVGYYIDPSTPLHFVAASANDMKQTLLIEGKSPATINRLLAAVKRVLNVAYKEWDWLTEPLADKIKNLSEKGLEREIYLSKEEVKTLINLIEDETVKRITLLAAYTGLRQGEIRGLTLGNWSKPYIILSNKTKSKKPRTIPVIEELHEVIETTQFNIPESRIRRHFEAAREKMQRPDIRFHDLRHTFASWLASDPDIPLTTIRDILGHSSLMVTSKYTHLRPANLDIVTKALKDD